MRVYVGIDDKDMPAPDRKVRYAANMFGPAMFHYVSETDDPFKVAAANGFELMLTRMSDELPDEHPLMHLYFENGECEKVFAAWRPKLPGGGWKIAGCHDTEDGPVAIFLRRTVVLSRPNGGGGVP